MDSKTFNRLIDEYFSGVNAGSANERTKDYAIRSGKITSTWADLSDYKKELKEAMGFKIDISIIRINGKFDNGVQIPFKN